MTCSCNFRIQSFLRADFASSATVRRKAARLFCAAQKIESKWKCPWTARSRPLPRSHCGGGLTKCTVKQGKTHRCCASPSSFHPDILSNRQVSSKSQKETWSFSCFGEVVVTS